MADKERQLWADVAKGAAVMGVVHAHVVGKHLVALDGGFSEGLLGFFRATVFLASPIRMPLFFLISGFFAVRALSLSWRELLSRKTLFFYSIYLLWLLIQTGLFLGQENIRTSVARNGWQFLLQATVDPTNLWFLYALALFFPLAKWALAAPRLSLVLGGLLALSPVAGLSVGQGNLGQLPLYFIWFLAGCTGHRFVSWWAGRVTLARLLVVALAFGITMLLLPDAHTLKPLVHLLASGAGTALGLGLSVLGVRRFPGMGGFLARHVGRHTLPIYVLQMPLIVFWHLAVSSTPLFTALLAACPVCAVCYPFLLTLAVSAAARLLQWVLAPPFPFLFQQPRWLLMRRAGPSPVGFSGSETKEEALGTGDMEPFRT